MKILHAIEGLDRASGVATFVRACADEMSRAGHEVAVIFVKTDELDFAPGVAKIAATDFAAVPWRPDVVHLHGIWSRFSLRVLLWCVRRRIPFVVSPHGGLMPRVFTHGRLKKHLVWRLVLRPLISRALAVHGTTETETCACRAAGLRGPFTVAPLGVELPDVARRAPTRCVLYLGRLSEEKGLVNLLAAWRQAGFADWRLVLAGPDWRGYRSVLAAKIAAEGIAGVEFAGPVAGEDKARLFREASVFVLPSPMENFSSVILEALAWGMPAIATKGTPWPELRDNGCGWWIDQGVPPLVAALKAAMAADDAERGRMGARGRQLAAGKYQWPKVAATLLAAYGGAKGER